MKTILVPTDFSDLAYNALEVAVGIAQQNNATLLLLHSVELSGQDSFNVEGEMLEDDAFLKVFAVELINKTKEKMSVLLDDPLLNNLEVKSIFRTGKPSQSITAVAKEQHVDLIVMGTLGSSGLQEILVGSNTERVVRHAPCPVLSVHKSPKKSDFQSIVVATTMDDWEAQMLLQIKDLQQAYGAKLHLVWINTVNNFRADTATKAKLEQFAERHNLENYTLNVFNDFSEEEGLINFAKSIDADMIAMNTHGFKGIARILAGSIAESVVNHTEFPVLTMAHKN